MVERLTKGAAVAALAREFNTSRNTIMRVREAKARAPMNALSTRARQVGGASLIGGYAQPGEGVAAGGCAGSAGVAGAFGAMVPFGRPAVRALRKAPDGLPRVSTYTIWRTLHEAGLSWQKSRTWCETGIAMRKRKHGVVRVSDPDAAVKRG